MLRGRFIVSEKIELNKKQERSIIEIDNILSIFEEKAIK